MTAAPAERLLSLEFISVLGMPPVEFVQLAAQLGCNGVGMALAPFTANPHAYPAWSLRDDIGLRRTLIAALKDEGVVISVGEGFLIRAGADITSAAPDLDLMEELGARFVNLVCIERDAARGQDQIATFADMAAQRGLAATLETMPGFPIGDMHTALAVLRSIDRGNLSLMIDAMHFVRSGSSPADLDACRPGEVGYLQLCDVPIVPTIADYGTEARHERLPLGAGEVPLAELIAHVPADCPLGLEIPLLSRAEAGVGPRDRLASSVDYARALMTAAGTH